MNRISDEREKPAKPRLLTKFASGFAFIILRFPLRKSTFTGFAFSFGFMVCSILKRWGGWRLLGHADVSTTMIHTHDLKIAGGAPSPLDALDFDAPLRHRDDSMLAKIDAMLL